MIRLFIIVSFLLVISARLNGIPLTFQGPNGPVTFDVTVNISIGAPTITHSCANAVVATIPQSIAPQPSQTRSQSYRAPVRTERWGYLDTLITDGNYTDPFRNQIVTYTMTRDWGNYRSALGDSFCRLIDSLGTSSHWLDLGTGDAQAIDTYPGAARATGITHYCPTEHRGGSYNYTVINGTSWERRRVLTKRYFEDIPNDQITFADVITDYYGVIAYARLIDVSLRKAFENLKHGGSFFIYLGNDEELNLTTIKVGTRTLNFEQWLRTIPGIRVYREGNTLQLVLMDRNQLFIPELIVIQEPEPNPHSPVPKRWYRQSY